MAPGGKQTSLLSLLLTTVIMEMGGKLVCPILSIYLYSFMCLSMAYELFHLSSSQQFSGPYFLKMRVPTCPEPLGSLSTDSLGGPKTQAGLLVTCWEGPSWLGPI